MWVQFEYFVNVSVAKNPAPNLNSIANFIRSPPSYKYIMQWTIQLILICVAERRISACVYKLISV